MSGITNTTGLVINSANPLTTANGGIGRSVTPTSGSILFYDATGVQQNNSSFFWNNSNLQLGIGTTSFDFTGVNFQITSSSVSGVSAVIRSSLTGSANQAALYVCRGDQTNGNALVRFVTGVAGATPSDWDIGTLNSGLSTPTNFVFSNTGGNRLLLSSAGILNLPSLTASQAVVTDSSKNLTSLAYTNANTASTLVERDSSGNFSAGTITASLSGTATVATTVSTTQVSNNATYFPCMFSSSTNSNQAPDLATGLTYNPNNNILSTTGLNLSGLTASYSLWADASKNIKSTNTANIYPFGTSTAALDPNADTGMTILSSTANTVSQFAVSNSTKNNFIMLWSGRSGDTNPAFMWSGNTNLRFGTCTAGGLTTAGYTNLFQMDSNGDLELVTGNLKLNTAGKTVQLATGTNACRGTATMSLGTATVSTTAAGTGNMIIVTGTGANSYGCTITNGVGFSITSSNPLDATTPNWVIIK